MRISRTTIHYGLDPQSKAPALLQSLQGARDACLVLLPNRYRKLNFCELLNHSSESRFAFPIFTIREFTASLFRQIAPGLRVLSDLEKRSLLLGLERSSEEPSIPGGVAQLSRLLASIKSRNITDPELLRLELLREKAPLPPSQERIVAFFATYQVRLRQLGYEDWEGCYCQVHDALITGSLELNQICPEARLLLAELPIGITPIEASIISLLSSEFAESHLLAPLEDARSASQLPGWSFLHKLGGNVQMDKAGPRIPRVVVHVNERSEMAWIADQVHAILTSGKVGAGVGIATSLPRYCLSELVQELEDRGIEVLAPSSKDRNTSSIARAFLEYLRTLESGFSRLAVFDLLAESRVNCGFDQAQLGRLERLAVRAQIEGSAKDFCSRLPVAADALRDEFRCEQEVVQLADLLPQLELDIDCEQPFREWYSDCVRKLQPYLNLDSLGAGEGRLFTQFREAIRLQAEVWGSRILRFPEFVELSKQCLTWRRQGALRGAHQVLIGAPADFQNCQLTHLFWCGMTEDGFPGRDNDPLSDEAIPAPFRTLSLDERLSDAGLIFRNLASSGSRSVCSYHDQLAERIAAPSPILKDQEVERIASPQGFSAINPSAKRNLSRGRRVQDYRQSQRPSLYSGFLTSDKARSSARALLWEAGITVSPSLLEAYASCGFRFFSQRILGLRKSAPSPLTPEGADLGKLLHRILYRFRRKGFVDPWACRPEGESDWVASQSLRMLAIARQEIDLLREQFLWGTGLFWEHPEQLLVAGLGTDTPRRGLLAGFVQQEWKWGRRHQAVQEELRVGPIPVGEILDGEGHSHRVELEGRLDRVDRSDRGLVVIDYKTGADARHRCYSGWGFQLPLYSMLTELAFQEPVSEALFLALRLPGQVRLEPLRMPREGRSELWAQLVQFYRTRLLSLTSQLHAGYFPPTLMGRAKAGCRTCDYREICRFEATQSSRLVRSGQLFTSIPLLDAGHWTGLDRIEN